MTKTVNRNLKFVIEKTFFDILVYTLIPERFGAPCGGESHSCPVHIRIFPEKSFEFLFERMIGIDNVEQVNYH